jgi:hypothetical protein
MNPWFFSCATLAVSAIYCIWKVYFRQRVIRDRVTYMLWVIANQRRANRAGSRITRQNGREQLSLPPPESFPARLLMFSVQLCRQTRFPPVWQIRLAVPAESPVILDQGPIPLSFRPA